jgi:hypothetical protein
MPDDLRLNTILNRAKAVIPMKYCDVIPAGLIATLRRRPITQLFLRPMTGAGVSWRMPKKERGRLYRTHYHSVLALEGLIAELHWVRKGTDAPENSRYADYRLQRTLDRR